MKIENLPVEDQAFRLVDGWYIVVDGRVHGMWRDRGAALAGLATEQRRAAFKRHDVRGRERAAGEGRLLPCGCTTGGGMCREHRPGEERA